MQTSSGRALKRSAECTRTELLYWLRQSRLLHSREQRKYTSQNVKTDNQFLGIMVYTPVRPIARAAERFCVFEHLLLRPKHCMNMKHEQRVAGITLNYVI